MDDASLPRPELPVPGWYHDGVSRRWWDGSSWGPGAMPDAVRQSIAEVREGTGPAVAAHIGGLCGGFVVPLVVRLTGGEKNEFARHHSSEALNFQLTILTLWVGMIVGIVGGAVLLGRGADGVAAGVFALVAVVGFLTYFGGLALSIVGMIRASRREWWRYPINIRFVRGARPAE